MKRIDIQASTIAAVLAVLGLVAACTNVSEVGDDGRGDSGALPGASEGLCGDGLDSDGDGFVDDGCPCSPGEVAACFPGPASARGRGACRDGSMLCPGSGEFSTWSGDCAGAVLPSDEACNGIDDDCDGVVDNGCEQTDGGVAGAGGSGGGAAGSGATGGAGGVAGTTGSTGEVCDNGIDDDKNGLIDDGCESQCPCAPGSIQWDRVQSPDKLTLNGWEAARSAWTGEQHLFAYVATEQEYADSSKAYGLYLARYDNAGVHLGTSLLADAPGTFAKTNGLVWTGESAVVLANDQLVRADADGSPIGAPVDSPHGNSIAWNGKEIGRLSYDTGKIIFDRLDVDLSVLGSPVELATSGSYPNLGWTGQRWVVVTTGETASHVRFLDGSTVVRDDELPASSMYAPMVATSGHGALVCGYHLQPGCSDTTPVTCQRYSAEGTPVGSPIPIDQGPFRVTGGGVFWWQCGYTVVLPGLKKDPSGWPVDTSRIVRILDDGTLQEVPLPKLGPDITSDGAYFWYFHSSFDDIEYSPGDLFFATRWFSPYMKSGRMRMSCKP